MLFFIIKWDNCLDGKWHGQQCFISLDGTDSKVWDHIPLILSGIHTSLSAQLEIQNWDLPENRMNGGMELFHVVGGLI